MAVIRPKYGINEIVKVRRTYYDEFLRETDKIKTARIVDLHTLHTTWLSGSVVGFKYRIRFENNREVEIGEQDIVGIDTIATMKESKK